MRSNLPVTYWHQFNWWRVRDGEDGDHMEPVIELLEELNGKR